MVVPRMVKCMQWMLSSMVIPFMVMCLVAVILQQKVRRLPRQSMWFLTVLSSIAHMMERPRSSVVTTWWEHHWVRSMYMYLGRQLLMATLAPIMWLLSMVVVMRLTMCPQHQASLTPRSSLKDVARRVLIMSMVVVMLQLYLVRRCGY